MKVWISRGKKSWKNEIHFWENDPVIGKYDGPEGICYHFRTNRRPFPLLEMLSIDRFVKLFHYKPKEGSCEEVELTIKRK